MLKKLGFYRGVNLGGWLSQCDYSEERLHHFITKADLEKIAAWGADHVRIPVDHNVLEEGDGFSEAGFALPAPEFGIASAHEGDGNLYLYLPARSAVVLKKL